MALLPPMNLRTTDTNPNDGRSREIAWDYDPAQTGTVGSVRLFTVVTGGSPVSATVYLGAQRAVVPANSGPYYVHIQNPTNTQTARSAQGVTAGPALPPAGPAEPPEPPPALTARQHLEAALGKSCPPGSVVGAVDVTVTDPRTVQDDGSLA